MKKYLWIAIVILIAGCNSTDAQLPYKPLGMPQLPHGSPEFTQGWKDGCETGFAVGGNDYYKSIYNWARTPQYEKSEVYMRAWKDSYNYCRQYVATWDKSFTAPENLVPADNYSVYNPASDYNENNVDNFLSLPTASGFLSLPSTGAFFGGDAVGTFFYEGAGEE